MGGEDGCMVVEEGLGVEELNLSVASSSNEIRSSDNKLMIKISQVKHAFMLQNPSRSNKDYRIFICCYQISI